MFVKTQTKSWQKPRVENSIYVFMIKLINTRGNSQLIHQRLQQFHLQTGYHLQ